MPSPFKFSLRTMIIVITLISALAGYLVYQTPRSFDRHQAPAYAVDMMDATDVEWDVSLPGELGGTCTVDYPRQPGHTYYCIMSIKTKQQKLFGSAGGFIINSVGPASQPIGRSGFYVFPRNYPDIDLDGATVWAEIRIENSSGSVLYHGVKESETYQEASARLNKQNYSGSTGIPPS
ncbi:hypothetical protein [Bremerella sp. P1]|uniref:hypothetical protein n=1 Tax=Bremerella sp. P1 TaxID=3026424 RepID=UPI0023677907|nr:hypothetical protein [Bremerella sp. P1]WDI42397.1 hypothetical protein PSR63_00365 [Bremerella sp. P1]